LFRHKLRENDLPNESRSDLVDCRDARDNYRWCRTENETVKEMPTGKRMKSRCGGCCVDDDLMRAREVHWKFNCSRKFPIEKPRACLVSCKTLPTHQLVANTGPFALAISAKPKIHRGWKKGAQMVGSSSVKNVARESPADSFPPRNSLRTGAPVHTSVTTTRRRQRSEIGIAWMGPIAYLRRQVIIECIFDFRFVRAEGKQEGVL